MIRLKCNNCDKIREFQDSDLEYECIASDPTRQMGTEREYSGNIDFNCDNCDNHILVEFNFWEYPVLALNYAEYNEEGAIVLEEPDYQKYLSKGEEGHYEEQSE